MVSTNATAGTASSSSSSSSSCMQSRRTQSRRTQLSRRCSRARGLTKTLRTASLVCVGLLWTSTSTSPTPSLVVDAYTVEQIQRFAYASSLAYLPTANMESSEYFEASGLTPLGQVVDPATESGATVFSHNHQLIVACRGSANPRNFGTNLKFQLVPATRLSQTRVPRDARVHQGFQEASVGLWQKLGPPVLETLRRQPFEQELTDIIFTGHSLGAATALLSAVHYTSTKNDPSMAHKNSNNGGRGNGSGGAYLTPNIVTFGGPKLCNKSLARYLRIGPLEGSDIVHLVHNQDPVLAQNKKLWDQMGLDNVGIEMHCDSKAPIIYEDEADIPGGGGGGGGGPFGVNVSWNLLNHCNYMGVFVGPRMTSGAMGGGSTSSSSSSSNARASIRSDQDRFQA